MRRKRTMRKRKRERESCLFSREERTFYIARMHVNNVIAGKFLVCYLRRAHRCFAKCLKLKKSEHCDTSTANILDNKSFYAIVSGLAAFNGMYSSMSPVLSIAEIVYLPSSCSA